MIAKDEEQIRALINQWATAVHSGDMNRVLADHADDIVMFDVPPPHDGVRGIAAYRETWPPFFEWRRRAPHSRSCPSTSPQATTSPMPTPCCAAAHRRNSPMIRRTASGSPSGCARSRADGSLPTNTTRSPPPPTVTPPALEDLADLMLGATIPVAHLSSRNTARDRRDDGLARMGCTLTSCCCRLLCVFPGRSQYTQELINLSRLHDCFPGKWR